MFRVMTTIAEDELVVISRKLKRGGHLLIREGPIAGLVIDVLRTVLQKDANRLALRFSNQGRVNMSATQIRKASDRAQHFAKFIRALPRKRPGTNPSRTRPANRASVRVFGQIVLLLDVRQNFFEQKSRVSVAKRIIFKTPVARRRIGCAIGSQPWFLARLCWKIAGIDEEANCDGHFLFVDQIVENSRHSISAIRFKIPTAILKNHHAGRFIRGILRRDINPP